MRLKNAFGGDFPLPLGEGGAVAPGEGSPLHDLRRLTESWGGLPSSGATAPPSPQGREGLRAIDFLSAASDAACGVARVHDNARVLDDELIIQRGMVRRD